MSENKSFIVRFIERQNLTETRLIYRVVKIVNFSSRIIVFVGLIPRLVVFTFLIYIFMILPVKEYGFIAVLMILIIGLIVAGIGYLRHRSEEAKGAPWRTLAASKYLTFVPVKFLGLRSHPSIIGNYRHHHLKLETFKKGQGEDSYTCTSLLVSVDKVENDSFSQKGKPLLSGQVSSKNAMSLLTPTSPHYILKGAQLKGSITAQTLDQIVHVLL